MSQQYRAGDFSVIPNMGSIANLTPSEFMVYAYLCWRAGKDKQAFPSYTTITEGTKLTRKTTIKAVAGLEKKGWIERVNRDRKNGSQTTNVYAIIELEAGVKIPLGSVNITPRAGVNFDPPLNITSYNNNHLIGKRDSDKELLDLLNRTVNRSFRVLPRGYKKTLEAFSLKEIAQALESLANDTWHKERLSSLSSDYFLRASTIDRFLNQPTEDSSFAARLKRMGAV